MVDQVGSFSVSSKPDNVLCLFVEATDDDDDKDGIVSDRGDTASILRRFVCLRRRFANQRFT